MNEILQQLKDQVAAFGPNLLAGLAVLVLGWLVALVVCFVVRALLRKTSVDNTIAGWMSEPDAEAAIPVEEWVGKAVFYLVMLVVLIAFFTTIKLSVVTEPLNGLVQPWIQNQRARS